MPACLPKQLAAAAGHPSEGLAALHGPAGREVFPEDVAPLVDLSGKKWAHTAVVALPFPGGRRPGGGGGGVCVEGGGRPAAGRAARATCPRSSGQPGRVLSGLWQAATACSRGPGCSPAMFPADDFPRSHFHSPPPCSPYCFPQPPPPLPTPPPPHTHTAATTTTSADVGAVCGFLAEQLQDEEGCRLSDAERARNAFAPALLLLPAHHPLAQQAQQITTRAGTTGGQGAGCSSLFQAAQGEQRAQGEEAGAAGRRAVAPAAADSTGGGAPPAAPAEGSSILSLLLPAQQGAAGGDSPGVLCLPLDIAGQEVPPFSPGLLPGALQLCL